MTLWQLVLQESVVSTHQCSVVPWPLKTLARSSKQGVHSFDIADIDLSRADSNKVAMFLVEFTSGSMVLPSVDDREGPELCNGSPKRPWKFAAPMKNRRLTPMEVLFQYVSNLGNLGIVEHSQKRGEINHVQPRLK